MSSPLRLEFQKGRAMGVGVRRFVSYDSGGLAKDVPSLLRGRKNEAKLSTLT